MENWKTEMAEIAKHPNVYCKMWDLLLCLCSVDSTCCKLLSSSITVYMQLNFHIWVQRHFPLVFVLCLDRAWSPKLTDSTGNQMTSDRMSRYMYTCSCTCIHNLCMHATCMFTSVRVCSVGTRKRTFVKLCQIDSVRDTLERLCWEIVSMLWTFDVVGPREE